MHKERRKTEDARLTTCRTIIRLFLILIVLAFSPLSGFAQTENSTDVTAEAAQSHSSTVPEHDEPQGAVQNSSQAPICGITHVGQCLKDLGHDQAGIWTSPLQISPQDAVWLVPFAAATRVALHYDAQVQQDLGIVKTRIDTSSTISEVGLYGSIASSGGLYLLGSATHNDHLAERGRLGEEAIINALLIVQGLKLASNRERPNEGNGRGGFWPNGTRQYETDGAFPSGHAAASWAFAQVIASSIRANQFRSVHTLLPWPSAQAG